jgi:hypothetical protein
LIDSLIFDSIRIRVFFFLGSEIQEKYEKLLREVEEERRQKKERGELDSTSITSTPPQSSSFRKETDQSPSLEKKTPSIRQTENFQQYSNKIKLLLLLLLVVVVLQYSLDLIRS